MMKVTGTQKEVYQFMTILDGYSRHDMCPTMKCEECLANCFCYGDHKPLKTFEIEYTD